MMQSFFQIRRNLLHGLLIFICASIILWAVSTGVEGRIWAGTKHLDRHIDARLKEQEIKPSKQSSDAEFLRRVHLDLTGKIPTVEAVVSFLEDGSKNKREKKIDELIGINSISTTGHACGPIGSLGETIITDRNAWDWKGGYVKVSRKTCLITNLLQP